MKGKTSTKARSLASALMLSGLLVVTGTTAPASAGEGNQATLGSREEGLYLSYEITGLDVPAGREVTATITSSTVTLNGTAYVASAGWTQPSITIAIGNEKDRNQEISWPTAADADANGFVPPPFEHEENFTFSHDVQAGDDRVWIHLGVKLGAPGADVRYYRVDIVAWVDATTPTTSGTADTNPADTNSPPDSTAPAGMAVIRGTVSVPTGLEAASQPAVLPLPLAPVVAYRGAQVLAQGSTDLDGSYALEVPTDTDGVQVEVQLVRPGAYEVRDDQSTEAARIIGAPFDVDRDDVEVDVSLDPASGSVTGANFPTEHVLGAARVAAFLAEAWKEATEVLGIPLDLELPLEAKVYSTEADPGRAPSTYAAVPGYPGSRTDPYLNFDPTKFDATADTLQFVVFHEFGHYLQADIQQDQMPVNPADTSHLGYSNPSTTDAWVEGFATFFALLVGRDVEGDPRAVISWYGAELDFDLAAYFPWDQLNGLGIAEEFAVAGLLWDLVDDYQNVSPLEATNDHLTELGIRFAQPLVAEQTLRPYIDRVQVDAQELFMVLLGDYSRIDPSPVTTGEGMPAYRGVFDVRQLHTVLAQQGIGAEGDSGWPGLTPLDAVFVAHGLFADTGPANLFHDDGEAIGTVAHDQLWVGETEIPAMVERRIPPPTPATKVQLTSLHDGAPVSDVRYSVTIEFDPTVVEGADGNTRTYVTRPDADGNLLVMLPDPIWNARAVITPTAGWAASEPLVIDSGAYWAAAGSGRSGALGTHTFTVTPTAGGGSGPWAALLIGLGAAGVLGFGWALVRRRGVATPPPPPPEPR